MIRCTSALLVPGADTVASTPMSCQCAGRVGARESADVKRHARASSGSVKSCAQTTPGAVARLFQSDASCQTLQLAVTEVPPPTDTLPGGHGLDCARPTTGMSTPVRPAVLSKKSRRFMVMRLRSEV